MIDFSVAARVGERLGDEEAAAFRTVSEKLESDASVRVSGYPDRPVAVRNRERKEMDEYRSVSSEPRENE